VQILSSPQAEGDGHPFERDSNKHCGWHISRWWWKPVSAALAAQLPQHSNGKQLSELPQGTRLRLSAGSNSGRIMVCLAPPQDPDMPSDDQLAADAVELLSAAVPGGCNAHCMPRIAAGTASAAVTTSA
jgi:hypothetical protein